MTAERLRYLGTCAAGVFVAILLAATAYDWPGLS